MYNSLKSQKTLNFPFGWTIQLSKWNTNEVKTWFTFCFLKYFVCVGLCKNEELLSQLCIIFLLFSVTRRWAHVGLGYGLIARLCQQPPRAIVWKNRGMPEHSAPTKNNLGQSIYNNKKPPRAHLPKKSDRNLAPLLVEADLGNDLEKIVIKRHGVRSIRGIIPS